MQKVLYADEGNIAIFDGKSFRRDKKTGYYLASKPSENGRRKRLHIYVWEFFNGKVPEGYHVHHIDHDKSNNDIGNLQMMTEKEHLSHHSSNMSDERKEMLRKHLIENAVKEGREWHSENGKEAWKKRKPKAYECTYCGAEFETLNRYAEESNRFCSNKCRSAYRRKMGLDNVTQSCEICGTEFVANKYTKRKRCDSCKHIRVRRA